MNINRNPFTAPSLFFALLLAGAPLVLPAAEQAAGAPRAAADDKKDLISVDFPSEEIRVVLRNVADLFELNLVVPDGLVDENKVPLRTSIKLRDVTWRQIYDVVLKGVGYTYIEEGNIIKIVRRDALDIEPLVSRVYILNYSKANEILPTIAPMVDTSEKVKGRIQLDQRNNALVISERPTVQKGIAEIIEKLDVATAQVMIETKFVEVTGGDSRNIGINWTSLDSYRVGTKGEVLSQPAKLTTIGNATSPNVYTVNTVPTNGLEGALSSLFSSPQIVSATFSAQEFGLILSAMSKTENVRLVSNPTVVTLNNVESTINIGEEFPIPNYSYNQEVGRFEINGFTYKAIGINLKVTPQVNNAGFIKLNIFPEVSSRAGEVSFGGASGALIPIIATRKTATQVSLKNGHTMGIGGLIESNSAKNNSKVPLLGSLPILGHAFKSKGNSVRTRNLVIFITAKTIDAGSATVEEVFDPAATRAMELRRSELPGHRASGSPFIEDAPAAK